MAKKLNVSSEVVETPTEETSETTTLEATIEESTQPLSSIHESDVKPEYVQVGHNTRTFRS
jgi:hypothetical protein